MINSVAHSSMSYGSSSNPYITPVNKALNNTANQSQAKSSANAGQSSEYHPSMSIYELENNINKAVQSAVDEKSNNITSQKDALWQAHVGQSYVESQKAMIDAYVTSATGESQYDSNDESKSLTENYMALVEMEMKLRNPEATKPEQPITPEKDFSIQPVDQFSRQLSQQQATSQYSAIQNQGRTSLLHMSV